MAREAFYRKMQTKTNVKKSDFKIYFETGDNIFWKDIAIQKAVDFLKKGRVLVIKGLGGYHLVVDARKDDAISKLRMKKSRYNKPFAVMMKSEDIKKYCNIGPKEYKLLNSKEAPIVLLKTKQNSFHLSKKVAPGLNTIGVMLPYSLIYRLVFDKITFPLVVTSANISGEPMEKDDNKVKKRLKDIADGFLTYDMPIKDRMDDSVVFFGAGKKRTIRRGRGYAPMPIVLDKKSPHLLACGGQNKNTFCLLKDEYAFLSHHIGDLGNTLTYEYYKEEIEKYKKNFSIEPEFLAKDLNPRYISNIYADKLKLPVIKIQHHHAHIAAVMAEYGIKNKVIGIAYDGTGLGTDGNMWGGEFLLSTLKDFKRVGQLDYKPLPGGDIAIRYPYRAALGYVFPFKDKFREYINNIDCDEKKIFMQIEKKLNTPLTSSMGRLFDVVASLVNLRKRVDFEGQAAMELESIILHCDDYYNYDIIGKNSNFYINIDNLLIEIYRDYIKGINPGIISAKFHNTVIRFTTELTVKLREIHKINKVVLSGGCFQNKYLLEGLYKELAKKSFETLIPSLIPINDEGISLGQAIIAREKL